MQVSRQGQWGTALKVLVVEPLDLAGAAVEVVIAAKLADAEPAAPVVEVLVDADVEVDVEVDVLVAEVPGDEAVEN